VHVGEGPPVAVEALPPLELLLLGADDRGEIPGADLRSSYQVLVENAHAAAGNRAHRQLGMEGKAELAHDEDVERRA
jgi:hypothetical protein